MIALRSLGIQKMADNILLTRKLLVILIATSDDFQKTLEDMISILQLKSLNSEKKIAVVYQNS